MMDRILNEPTITILASPLPPKMQERFDQQMALMESITPAVIRAMNGFDLVCKTYWMTCLATLQYIQLSKQLILSTAPSAVIEAWFDKQVEDYLARLQQIPDLYFEQVLDILVNMRTELEQANSSLLDELIDLLKRRLQR